MNTVFANVDWYSKQTQSESSIVLKCETNVHTQDRSGLQLVESLLHREQNGRLKGREFQSMNKECHSLLCMAAPDIFIARCKLEYLDVLGRLEKTGCRTQKQGLMIQHWLLHQRHDNIHRQQTWPLMLSV